MTTPTGGPPPQSADARVDLLHGDLVGLQWPVAGCPASVRAWRLFTFLPNLAVPLVAARHYPPGEVLASVLAPTEDHIAAGRNLQECVDSDAALDCDILFFGYSCRDYYLSTNSELYGGTRPRTIVWRRNTAVAGHLCAAVASSDPKARDAYVWVFDSMGLREGHVAFTAVRDYFVSNWGFSAACVVSVNDREPTGINFQHHEMDYYCGQWVWLWVACVLEDRLDGFAAVAKVDRMTQACEDREPLDRALQLLGWRTQLLDRAAGTVEEMRLSTQPASTQSRLLSRDWKQAVRTEAEGGGTALSKLNHLTDSLRQATLQLAEMVRHLEDARGRAREAESRVVSVTARLAASEAREAAAQAQLVAREAAAQAQLAALAAALDESRSREQGLRDREAALLVVAEESLAREAESRRRESDARTRESARSAANNIPGSKRLRRT
jgi:hypothetical protein